MASAACCDYKVALDDGSLARRLSEGILLTGNFTIRVCDEHLEEARFVFNNINRAIAKAL